MKFAWPHLLWVLALLPLFAWACFKLRRTVKLPRKTRANLLVTLYGLDAPTDQIQLQQPHSRVPAILFICGVALLLAAISRPQYDLTRLHSNETLIFAIDVSGSMDADDIPPNRLTAVKKAVKMFIEDLPASTLVGVVAFSSDAQLSQRPTTEHAQARAAIDALVLQSSTAIGEAILISLEAVFPGSKFSQNNELLEPEVITKSTDKKLKSAAIILITDGENSSGTNPMDAVVFASDYGVRIYTVGVGTEQGAFLPTGQHAGLDEKTLRTIAKITGGEYYRAASVENFQEIYKQLGTKLVLRRQWEEVSAFFVALAMLLMLISAGISLQKWGRVL